MGGAGGREAGLVPGSKVSGQIEMSDCVANRS